MILGPCIPEMSNESLAMTDSAREVSRACAEEDEIVEPTPPHDTTGSEPTSIPDTVPLLHPRAMASDMKAGAQSRQISLKLLGPSFLIKQKIAVMEMLHM